MTQFAHSKIWRLAWPVIVSNISVPMLAAVDTAVVGRLPGEAYLGAVAVGSLIFSVMFAGFNFLRMGTTGLTAQAYGGGHRETLVAWLVRALGLALVLGLVLVILQGPISRSALLLIKATPEVTELAGLYFGVRIWALPAALVNMVCVGWLFGVHQTRIALWIQVLLNGLNMVLDVWFVLGLGWGVAGAAGATVLAEWVAGLLGLYAVHRQLRANHLHWRFRGIWERVALLRMLKVNGDIFLRSACLQAAFFAFTAKGARLGELVLAANAVLMNFQIFASYALDGLANVAEILSGQALGEGNREKLRRVVRATALQSLLVAVAFSLVWWLAGGALIDGLTDLVAVRSYARTLLPWLVVLPIISVWCFLLDGVFIGTTHTRAMRNSMAFSLACFLLSIPFFTESWGNDGLWASFSLFMLVRGLSMAVGLPRLLRA